MESKFLNALRRPLLAAAQASRPECELRHTYSVKSTTRHSWRSTSRPRYFSTTSTANIHLIDTKTLRLTEFVGSGTPPYAILSHTWGDQEVSLQEMRGDSSLVESKLGFKKIERFCQEALTDGHEFVWVDSCCIDKQSSADLSEAINSMYKWYQNSSVCYAYLSDVPTSGSPRGLNLDLFSRSRWFTRGWTLQELIAPKTVKFFARDWSLLGTRQTLARQLEAITRINWEVLVDDRDMSSAALARTCIAQRMLWASGRQTTRDEDMAYCLMGLFQVHMPIIYGEGLSGAFKRLQLEVIKTSPDQSIFAWSAPRKNSGLLAESPADFAQSSSIIQGTEGPHWWATYMPFSMTNFGISINLPLYEPPDAKERAIVLARIGIRRHSHNPLSMHPIMIYLKAAVRVIDGTGTKCFYRRVRCEDVIIGPMERSTAMYGAKHAHAGEHLFVPEDELYHAFHYSRSKWAGSQFEAFVE